MADTCPSCGGQLGEGMKFCPYCGLRVAQGPVPPAQLQMGGPPPPSPYGQWPYPMQAMPYPPPYYYMRPPVTARRALGITGGILLIIGGSLAMIPGIIFVLDYTYDTSSSYIGLLNIIAFCLAIVGAVAAFKRTFRVMALVGPAFLIGSSAVSMYAIDWFAIILMLLGILSLVFMVLGFPDMKLEQPWPGWSQPVAGGPYAAPAFGGAAPPMTQPGGATYPQGPMDRR